jgi:hypothetical protein
MTLYYIELTFTVKGHESPAALDEHLNDVADCLVELEGVTDPDLGASLAEGRVDFTMTVEAVDEPKALRKALVAIRTAIHAGEGCTPGWEKHFTKLQQTVRRADPVDA